MNRSERSRGRIGLREVSVLNSFYMSKTEVTVGQYRACVQAGACSEPSPYNPRVHWN